MVVCLTLCLPLRALRCSRRHAASLWLASCQHLLLLRGNDLLIRSDLRKRDLEKRPRRLRRRPMSRMMVLMMMQHQTLQEDRKTNPQRRKRILTLTWRPITRSQSRSEVQKRHSETRRRRRRRTLTRRWNLNRDSRRCAKVHPVHLPEHKNRPTPTQKRRAQPRESTKRKMSRRSSRRRVSSRLPLLRRQSSSPSTSSIPRQRGRPFQKRSKGETQASTRRRSCESLATMPPRRRLVQHELQRTAVLHRFRQV